ncbi:Uncharacterised protein [Mycobacteroides abscessus subsp. abscessus]|nr:Uncharacterised protein [Mycobacteroides abscessus subsp. abscessus]
MNDVVTSPARKSASSSTACRKGMLVETPRIRNSVTARLAREIAVGRSRPRQVSFTSMESKWAPTSAPRVAPPSRRTPAPPGVR